MRGVVWLLLLFGVAVVAATALGRNDGLVTLYWAGWRTDLSLNLFVLLVAGVCALVMLAIRALDSLLSLPERARAWRSLQRERAAGRALREAQAEYFGARYSRAHKAAARAIAIYEGTPGLPDDADVRLLAHLLAAGSLHRLQDRGRRDEALKRAMDLAKHGSLRSAADGAHLWAAEWALDDRDAAQALDQLATLPPGVARRTQALRLKLQAARMARDPLQALHTARLLAKHQAFSSAAAQGLLRSLAIEALEVPHDAEQLRRQWQALDITDRRDAAVAARAAQRAVALGAPDDGRTWLRPLWENLDELPADERALVAGALGDAAQGVGVDWLPRVESALTRWPADPAVVAAAGIVFAERQLWGKARRPLEQAAGATALDPRTRRRAWRLLAALAREEGDDAQAARCDRAAAEIG
ncbi:MAG TPA: heme biosynthesis HemY N-terminal domain-containing protein [Rubrivivax sp.]